MSRKSLSLILILTGFKAFALQGSIDSSNRQIKVDLISVYNTFFDVRQQLRLGIEYEKKFRKNFRHNFHLDLGLYDRYQYKKYYDFFGTSGGLNYKESNVRTMGFHLIYGIKYLLRDKDDKKIKYFTALVSDFNFFSKRIKTIDHRSDVSESSNMQQFRIGLGPEAGLELKINSRISLEAKTSFILKLLTVKTKDDSPNIKPYKALWYDSWHSFWIIPRLNISYAF